MQDDRVYAGLNAILSTNFIPFGAVECFHAWTNYARHSDDD